MLRIFKKNKGFTLIEISTTIFIVVVLSAILIANFPRLREQFALKRASHQLIQDLRRAQEMAMSARKVEGVGCVGVVPEGYGIYINILGDNKGYILYADKDGDENYTLANDCQVETIQIRERGIIIKEVEGAIIYNEVAINFKPPNPNIKIQVPIGSETEVKITLAIERDLSKTKIIAVNKAGLIEAK